MNMEYDKETFEVMRDIPDLKKDIKEVERDLKTGAYKKYITLEELLEEEGFKEKKKHYGKD